MLLLLPVAHEAAASPLRPPPSPRTSHLAGYCPTGDDPLTLCASTNTKSYQEVRFTLGSAVAWDPMSAAVTPTYNIYEEAMDYFGTSGTVAERAARAAAPGAARVTYTDQFGGKFVAHAATNVFVTSDVDGQANDALEAVLESLPEQKVKNVIVTSALTDSTHNGGVDNVLERRYVVTFVPDATNSANVAQQRALTCDSGYSCSEAGCQPMVSMPFLYRYAGMDADVRIGTSFVTSGASGAGNIQFYAGSRNTDADWNAGKFIRLHASSQPQMPFNVPVDTGVTSASKSRYDIRIMVAVIDPANALDDANDIVYVRVTSGHTNITSNLEAIGYAGWPTTPAYTGVWGAINPSAASSPAKPWKTTLTGFTPLGPIVADASGEFKMAVPGAPGVMLHFAKANVVANDGWGRWYEVVAKLPHCTVNTLDASGEFTAIDGSALTAVDAQVENVECSNRGACDRAGGLCKVRPWRGDLAVEEVACWCNDLPAGVTV